MSLYRIIAELHNVLPFPQRRLHDTQSLLSTRKASEFVLIRREQSHEISEFLHHAKVVETSR